MSSLNYLIEDNAEGRTAAQKLISVAFSIICINRLKLDVNNFNMIRYAERKYPLIKKEASGALEKLFTKSLRVVRRLINEKALRSVAVIIAKKGTKEPLEIIDQYRIKTKFAEDDCVQDDGTPFDVKLHSRNMLDELSRYSQMGVELPHDAQVFVSYETNQPEIIESKDKDFVGVVPHQHDENILDSMPSRAFGRLDTPYAYVAMKAWSKNILEKKLEISKVTSRGSNLFDYTYA
ncbi:Oidioi.mRNA.OKI2018_I69.chr1.g2214.t1.cds [Oikopleura dioica]|uniref:Oidioi.mRNA.OKI2018_I69.chr1.g2214.t1.cds n=1 Tax=Oikopleura dioica TaxID=34765 RepID=A0ABN7SQF7_OIKDI|nr:Oidioi.mRNA.OKI2018_I69.chr1.g2214.t1.cds [Oikopleura dioica]